MLYVFLVFVIGLAILGMCFGMVKVLDWQAAKGITNNPPEMKHGIPASDFDKLSWPAKQIIKWNHELPVESRADGLLPIVKALDIKHGKDAVDAACTRWSYGSYGYEKGYRYPAKDSPERLEGGCLFEYIEIQRGLEAIAKAYEQQTRALEVAGVQDDLDQVKDIAERLRAEADIINQATKELTE